jgi:protein ImuA
VQRKLPSFSSNGEGPARVGQEESSTVALGTNIRITRERYSHERRRNYRYLLFLMSTPLAALLNHPALWRGGELARGMEGIPTGFPALDVQLPGGGWPRGALTEILVEQEGVGELKLLCPALAALSQGKGWLALVTPPYLPYAPALAASGIDLSKIVLIRASSTTDACWAMEQALRSGVCSAVLGWMSYLTERGMRRLQLAAEAGACLSVCFASSHHAGHASSAALRLKIAAGRGKTGVHILKRRGGGTAAPLFLDLHHAVGQPLLSGPTPATL